MRNRIGIGLLTLALAAAPAVSQQASAPSVTGETGLFTLLDGQTLPQGKWSFGIYYNNWDRLVAPIPGGGLLAPLSDDWDYDWNRLSASFGYGITDRFELSVMLPWEDLSASDNNRLGYVNGRLFENRIDGSGIGNVRLGGKYRVFGGPEAERSMAVNAFIELPTGDEEEGIVTGDTGWGLGANWNLGTRWVLGVGYRDPGDADRFDVAQEFTAGVGYVATLNDRFDWITELAATLYQGGDSRPDDAFDLTTGGRYWFGDGKTWAVNFGLRLELAQLSDTDEHCPIGGLLGLTFIPRLAGGPQPPPPPPPPPSGPQGDAACAASQQQAASWNIEGAVALFRKCEQTGGTAAGLTNARVRIRLSSPKAVRDRAFLGNCKGAKSARDAAASIGEGAGAAAAYAQSSCAGQ